MSTKKFLIVAVSSAVAMGGIYFNAPFVTGFGMAAVLVFSLMLFLG